MATDDDNDDAAAHSYPKRHNTSSLTSHIPSNNNASKFYYHFLYKAAFFLVILVPFLSSHFINQNLHNTRSWEFLQLIFVGIAVSYGLFSKTSGDQTHHKQHHHSTFENAQSYVSGLLQASSVFDDDDNDDDHSETQTTPSSSSSFDHHQHQLQTWNSQYFRGEPVVVLAKETPLHKHTATSSKMSPKPLLLPVRSLNSRLSEPEILETTKESSTATASLTRSSSGLGSKRFSNNANQFRNREFAGVSPEQNSIHRSGSSKRFSGNTNTKSRNEEFGVSSPLNLEEGSVVHRSGSSKRFSGNTNTKSRNEEFGVSSPLNLEEGSVVHRSPIPWRSRSGEMEMKEDVNCAPLMEKSESNRLLQSHSFRSLSSKSSRADSNSPSPMKLSPSPSLPSPKKLSPSPSWSWESQSKSIEDVARKKSFHRSSPPPPPPPPPPYLLKSRLMKSNCCMTNDEVSPIQDLRRSIRSVPMELSESESVEPPRRAHPGSELKAGGQSNGSFTGNSVGTMRPSEANDATTLIEKREYSSEKLKHEKLGRMSKRSLMEEEKEEYMEKVVVETDTETETEESEDDYFEEVRPSPSPSKEEVVESSGKGEGEESEGGGAPAADVDKKADEFIAKFREQIRLQRIESIRRSTTNQHLRNHSR